MQLKPPYNMPRKRKQSPKTKPPSILAAAKRPIPDPNFVFNAGDSTYTVRYSIGINAATKDELGYPLTHLRCPSFVRDAEGLLDVERATTQEAFILYMYAEAPGRLRALHEIVYPSLESVLNEPTRIAVGSNLLDQLCWSRGADGKMQFRFAWQHIQEPTPGLEDVRNALLAWLAGRDLWNEWFIGFCLDLLQDRHYRMLTEVPLIDELYRQIVQHHDTMSVAGDDGTSARQRNWDELELPAITVENASDYDFDAIQGALLEAVRGYLPILRSEHVELRKRRRQEVGFKKRSFDHYRWLVKRIWLGHSFARIADDEAARFVTLYPDETIDAPDCEAVQRACEVAAAYLSVDFERGIPAEPLEN